VFLPCSFTLIFLWDDPSSPHLRPKRRSSAHPLIILPLPPIRKRRETPFLLSTASLSTSRAPPALGVGPWTRDFPVLVRLHNLESVPTGTFSQKVVQQSTAVQVQLIHPCRVGITSPLDFEFTKVRPYRVALPSRMFTIFSTSNTSSPRSTGSQLSSGSSSSSKSNLPLSGTVKRVQVESEKRAPPSASRCAPAGTAGTLCRSSQVVRRRCQPSLRPGTARATGEPICVRIPA
jgi:hypothetical protein